MQDACIALAAFHEGKISKESLLAGRPENEPVRTTIPLKDRWAVLKRDNYRCVKCGANPSSNHEIELEVDHIFPVAKGGGNSLENLQVLCRECNQGKKDR
ncbi:MAG: HNH endonuclease [Nitrosomonadales bacterium]|nr:HNH endonuclease [Nitrosomonadales bacterium]